MIRALAAAICIGLMDGFESPYDLGMGMTWENNWRANEWYDHAVNIGQSVGRFFR